MTRTVALLDDKAEPEEIAGTLNGVDITALRKVEERDCILQWHNKALWCRTRTHTHHPGGVLKLDVHNLHNKGLVEKDSRGYFSITKKGLRVLKAIEVLNKKR